MLAMKTEKKTQKKPNKAQPKPYHCNKVRTAWILIVYRHGWAHITNTYSAGVEQLLMSCNSRPLQWMFHIGNGTQLLGSQQALLKMRDLLHQLAYIHNLLSLEIMNTDLWQGKEHTFFLVCLLKVMTQWSWLMTLVKEKNWQFLDHPISATCSEYNCLHRFSFSTFFFFFLIILLSKHLRITYSITKASGNSNLEEQH